MDINSTRKIFKIIKTTKIFFAALFVFLLVGVGSASGATLYSYQTGLVCNWNDANTWTTNSSGTTLVGSAVPADGDVVVILSGQTVKLTSDLVTTTLNITLQDGGILDLSTFKFTQTITSLSGQGVLKLSSGTFPTVTTNTLVSAGGGTVEYYNTTVINSTQQTYNNLIVSNYSTSANSIYLSSTSSPSYVINGDFTLKNFSTGSLTFSFGNSTPSDLLISMTVNGDFIVNSGCNVRVNNFATAQAIPNSKTSSTDPYYVHTLYLLGNLTNNGSIRFTGLPSPVNNAYYKLATNAFGVVNYGDVAVFFQGSSDNTVTCNGVTDFFRLIVEKGTDQTYVLSVNSSNVNNFALYAPNNQGLTGTTGGPEGLGCGYYYKALFIHKGTLKLGANISIPSLSEGGLDFNIIPTAALWINGANVSTTVNEGVNNTGYQAATLSGRLQISAGQFSTGDAAGLVLFSVGLPELIIEGSGTLDVSQVWAAAGTNLMSYTQTGGTANFRLRGENHTGPMLGLSASNSAFTMTGGTLNFTANTFIDNTYNYNIMDIGASVANCSVTGGTINFNLPSSATTYIANSTAPFYNVNISRNASTPTLTTSIQWNPGSTSPNANLTVLNDLNVGATSTLNLIGATVPPTVPIPINLNVAHNFSIAPLGTYTPGTNTTTFNGFGGSQLFSIGSTGTITGGLNNLTLANTSMVTIDNAITVNAGLTIGDGCKLNDAGKTITVKGNITNSGTHMGTGSITMAGTAVQTIDGEGSGVFQNLTLNNASGAANSAPISLLANIAINGTLTLSAANRLFNIKNFNLALGSAATIASSATNYIVTNGDPGDGGITKVYSTTTFDFPVGSTSTNRTAYAYTPASISLSATPTTYGSITVIPIGFEHPNTTSNGRSLTYFWRVKSSGFNLGSATVTHGYTYSVTDVATGANITEAGYVAAKYDRSTYSWTKGTASDLDKTNKIIGEPGIGSFLQNVNFIDGDYTAGDDSPTDPFGTVNKYYSRNGGGIWTTPATWSTTGCNGGAASTLPTANDVVIICAGDSVYLPSTQSCASLEVNGVFNIVDNYQSNFGIVYGIGKIKFNVQSRTNRFPLGDFTQFCGQSGGTIEYLLNTGSNLAIPSLSTTGTYYNLMLTNNNANTLSLSDAKLTIYNNFISQRLGVSTGINQINTSGTTRTLTVNGNLSVLSGTFQFPNASAQNVIVNGNVSVSNGASFIVKNSGTITNTLTVTGNITNNGTLNFKQSSFCNLTFNGAADAVFDGTGSNGTNLNNLIINKGSSQAASLTFSVSGALSTPGDNWLTLQNGTFIYTSFTNLPISTTTPFTIPITAGLTVNTAIANNVLIANSASSTNDLFLNGNLAVVSGNVYVGPTNGTTANNNDIEYSASGTSTINIQGGKLIVNGQIRRNPATSSGILQYIQSGGALTINGQAAITTNAKLEVLNVGSVFNMSSGTITIVRGGGGSTFGDVYLRPGTSTVTGGEIIFDNTTAQSYKLDADIPLYDLTINNATTTAANQVNLMVSPLVLTRHLTLGTNSTFNAKNGTNSIDLTINGDLSNSGTYTYGTNKTTFNGNVQTIKGNSITNFYDLQINPVTSVTLNGTSLVYTVIHNLTLSRGQLINRTNSIYLKGDITNNATYDGDATTGGVILKGTTLQQHIAGNGTFGRLELDNPFGSRLDDHITMQKNLILTTGIFDLDHYLLTLQATSIVTASGTVFSATKMITTDGVYSNVGIKKYFNSGASTFTYPLGTGGKYTPATLTITASSSVGSVRLNNINSRHPGVITPYNVLKYYWDVASESLSGFAGNLVLNYAQSDVIGTESNYVAAELLVPGVNWSKAAIGATTDNVDETTHKITFNYTAGTNSISGEYTAGIDGSIPDIVPQFISNTTGDWNNPSIWSKANGSTYDCPAGGPNGFIVTIRPSDIVTANVANCSAYRTTINGKLKVASGVIGHNFGTVDGNGTLYLESGGLPAGRYTDFFNCSNGGTLEFGGTATSYTLISGYLFQSLPRLFFTGTGTRILPNNDMTVCSMLKIDGPTVDNSVYNKKITIHGTMERYYTGVFTSGSGAISFAGSSAQTIGGALGDFSGTSAFNNFEINNSSGITLNGPTDVKGNLLLTAGNINTTSTNILTVSNTLIDCVTPAGGSATSYINGPLTKSIIQGDNFLFPVGKGANLGNLLTLSVTESGTLNWTVEYFNPNSLPFSPGVLTGVNTKEYWNVASTSGSKAYVNIKWISSSDLTPLMTLNGLSDMNVAQHDGTNWTQLTSSATGTDYNGSATTTSKIVIPAALNYNYTLACTSTPKPKITLAPTGPVCGTAGIPVTLSSSIATSQPYSITYTKGGVAQTPFTPTSFPATLPTDAAGGVYQITGFTYTSGTLKTGVFDPTAVTVYALPTTANAGSNQSLCGATSATLAGNSPSSGTGQWSIVNGAGGTVTTPTSATSTFSGTNGSTYTLRWTISNGTCTSSNDVVIDFPLLASQPAAFTASRATVSQGTTGVVYTVPNDPTVTYTWTYTTGSGATIIGTTNSVTVNFSNTATSGNLNVTAQNSCSTPSAARTIAITVKNNIWTGAASKYWNNTANWQSGMLPPSGADIAFASPPTNDLELDADYTVGSFTNTSVYKLIIPAGRCLTANTITTSNSTNQILIQAGNGSTPNGSLIFHNARTSPVYATVEMYSIASCLGTKTNYQWEYFGIPVRSVVADPTFYGSYVRRWDETLPEATHWVELNNASILTPFTGYEITQELAKTIVFQGLLVNSDTTFIMSVTGTLPKYQGQHIYANPYTAAIHIKSLGFTAGTDYTVYLYNTGSSNQWSQTPGTFSQGNNSPGQYNSIPQSLAGDVAGLPAQISSMQGFLVFANTNNATFSIPYSSVESNTVPQRAPATANSSDKVCTRIDVKGEHYSDCMWIFSSPNCTRGYDNGWDGRKMLGSALAPQLYAMETDGNYQVNSIPDMNNTELAFQAGEDVEDTLTFTHQNIETRYAGIYLVDLVENKTVDITVSGSTYTFSAASTPEPVKRFKIVTRSFEKDATDAESLVKIFSSQSTIFVQNLSSINGECILYDIAGNYIKKVPYNPNTVTVITNSLIPGAYIVKAITGADKVSKRLIVR